jgi:hypothetical protein
LYILYISLGEGSVYRKAYSYTKQHLKETVKLNRNEDFCTNVSEETTTSFFHPEDGGSRIFRNVGNVRKKLVKIVHCTNIFLLAFHETLRPTAV